MSDTRIEAKSHMSLGSIYKEHPKFSAVLTIVGTFFIALAIISYLYPGCWKGGVFPRLEIRVAALSVLSTLGVIGIATPFAAALILKICLHK